MARPNKNSAEYFSHDTWLRDDPKIKYIRQKHGLTGYAVFTMCLEYLASQDDFEAEYSPLSLALISWDFGVQLEELKEILHDFFIVWLLIFDEKSQKFYSNWLKKRLEKMLEKREKMKANAEKRWNEEKCKSTQKECKSNAIAFESDAIASKNNAIASFFPEKTMQSKGKESKGKNTWYDISSLRSEISYLPSNLDDLSDEQTDFSLKKAETEKINEPITGSEKPRAAQDDQPERPTAAEPEAQSRYARELAWHEESFAIFWAKYPRKVSKQEAFKAWKNLTKKAQKVATDAIDAHRDYWLKTDREKDKIPHAATWLRGKRWEDEVNFTPVAVDAAREKFQETERKNAEIARQKDEEIAQEKQKLLQFFRNLPDAQKAELRQKAHEQTAKIIKPETMGFDAMVKAKLHVLTRQLFESESQK